MVSAAERRRRRKRKTTASDLPDDVVVEIVSRLPPRSIITGWRAVSKSWRRVTASPAFYNTITPRARPLPVAAKVTVQNTTVVCLELFGSHPINAAADNDDDAPPPYPRALWLGGAVPRNNIGHVSTLVLGSWDGVLCLDMSTYPSWKTGWKSVYVLWNPLTNACATVAAPPVVGAGGGGGNFVGAYAHPETGRFHLLHATGRIVGELLMSPAAFLVHTVGGNNDAAWRVAPARPPDEIVMPIHNAARPVALHGKLHWVVQSGGRRDIKLLAFDTVREDFRLMEAPEQMGTSKIETTRVAVPPSPAGKLCTIAMVAGDANSALEMEVWVLDDYGDDRRSWRLMARTQVPWGWYFSMDAQVGVARHGADGEEDVVFVHTNGRVDEYSLRRGSWQANKVGRWFVDFAHENRELVLRHEHSMLPLPLEVSFGAASRVLPRSRSRYEWGKPCYCLV
uniref:F-box domain-containing protein n=1 Tax=Leersia perrieri TaxID=77586 RepID=A0A0D9VUH1_9ORYZ